MQTTTVDKLNGLMGTTFTIETKQGLSAKVSHATPDQLRSALFLVNNGLPPWLTDLVASLAAEIKDDESLTDLMTELVKAVPYETEDKPIDYSLCMYEFCYWVFTDSEIGLSTQPGDPSKFDSAICLYDRACQCQLIDAQDWKDLRDIHGETSPKAWASLCRATNWVSTLLSHSATRQFYELNAILNQFAIGILIFRLGDYCDALADTPPELWQIYHDLEGLMGSPS
jgi:hypothetical protein